jgi:hypothetical protein
MSDEPLPRSRLRTTLAPRGAHRLLVSLRLPLHGGTLIVEYVPDRDLLVRESLVEYLRLIAPAAPETVAMTVAEDLANELVPLRHRVTVEIAADGIVQTATVEDRQPGEAAPWPEARPRTP